MVRAKEILLSQGLCSLGNLASTIRRIHYKDVFWCKLYHQLPLLNGQEETFPRNSWKEDSLNVYPWLLPLTSTSPYESILGRFKRTQTWSRQSAFLRVAQYPSVCWWSAVQKLEKILTKAFRDCFQSHPRRNQWCKQASLKAKSQAL